MVELLWTDKLIFLLLTAVVGFALFARRREHLRAPWRQVGRSPIAMASLVVLAGFVFIGLLDSMHYRPSLPRSAQGEPAGYSTEILSVFDRMVTHLRDMEEKTYSAPFATHLFVKETVEAASFLDEKNNGGEAVKPPDGLFSPCFCKNMPFSPLPLLLDVLVSDSSVAPEILCLVITDSKKFDVLSEYCDTTLEIASSPISVT